MMRIKLHQGLEYLPLHVLSDVPYVYIACQEAQCSHWCGHAQRRQWERQERVGDKSLGGPVGADLL